MQHAEEQDPGVGTARAVPHVGLFVAASLLLHAVGGVIWAPDPPARVPGAGQTPQSLRATLVVGAGDPLDARRPAARFLPPVLPSPAVAILDMEARAGTAPPSHPSIGVPAKMAPDAPPAAVAAVRPDLAAWLAQQRAVRGAAVQAGLEAALQDLPPAGPGEIHCTLTPREGANCEGLEAPGLAEPVARVLAAAGTARREGLLASPAILMAHGTTIRVTWTAD
jgi:hypothetical protein